MEHFQRVRATRLRFFGRDGQVRTLGQRHSMRHLFGERHLWPNKLLEPTAAPLPGLAQFPFRAAGSSGCGSAFIR
jgi:hypothetical protein